MTVGKHKCTGCKKFFPAKQMIVAPAGKFHNRECLVDYGMNNTAKVIEKAKDNKKKANARQKKAYYDNHKGKQLEKAVIACNRYIVARDGPICISCGTTDPGLRYSAGHYKSAGAYPELRFHTDNIHSQCWWNCNKNRSGNIVEYRPNLLIKIGPIRMAHIEGPQYPQHYTIDDYRDIQDYYRAKIKVMKS